jgi:hypothetical protein
MRTTSTAGAIYEAARLAQPVFAAEGWTYATTHPAVPTVGELEAMIGRLVFTLLADEETTFVSSGRFTVRRNEGDFEIHLDLAEVPE